MSKKCQLTGKTGQFGHRVSHAKNRTKHLFDVNLQNKQVFFPSLEKTVKLHESIIYAERLIQPDSDTKNNLTAYKEICLQQIALAAKCEEYVHNSDWPQASQCIAKIDHLAEMIKSDSEYLLDPDEQNRQRAGAC